MVKGQTACTPSTVNQSMVFTVQDRSQIWLLGHANAKAQVITVNLIPQVTVTFLQTTPSIAANGAKHMCIHQNMCCDHVGV